VLFQRRRSSLISAAFFIAATISAIGCIAVTVGYARQFFVTDVFHYLRWNPTTMRYTVAEATFAGGGVSMHSESTTALATDNTSKIRAIVGPSNAQLTHRRWPGSPALWDRPVLWGDHYRCTPSIGVNVNGLSDCWSLQFRFDALMGALAILPMLWMVMRVRRALVARRPLSAFPVVAQTPASAK
jgi:hypothetical protein